MVEGAGAPETGYVSELEPAGPDPAVAAQDAADAAAADADGVPACTGPDLDPELAGFDAAAGSRFAIVLATNDSGAPCAVDGRPDLSFLRASGTEPGSPSSRTWMVAAPSGSSCFPVRPSSR
ncbi:DUF4232 domain-containing protein [Oerskovia sp. M15]